MKPIIQQHETGCGIAAVANIVGKTYSEVNQVANAMGIYATDPLLWSETNYIRQLLCSFGFQCSQNEFPFELWSALPSIALLAIKYQQIDGKFFWHWVVFKRVNKQSVVLDSATDLAVNIRTDFDKISPKWFILVTIQAVTSFRKVTGILR